MGLWGNRRNSGVLADMFKSPEQLAEEAKQREIEQEEKAKEYEEHRKKFLKELQGKIKELKKEKYVKIALSNGIETRKTADEILKSVKSHFPAYVALIALDLHLKQLAGYLDQMEEFFPTPEQLEQRSKRINLFPVAPPGSDAPPITERPVLSSEGNEVRKILKGLQSEKHRIYNNQKLAASPKLFGFEEDPEATPLTFYNLNRIRKFISSLPNDAARLVYLRKMKNAFLDDDKKGVTKIERGEHKKADKNFLRSLENEITIYHDVLWLGQNQHSNQIGNSEEKKKGQRAKGETFDRTILFFYFLLDYLEVKCQANTRAKILSELTGFSENTIENFFRHHDKRAINEFTLYEKDIEYVIEAFKKLKLTEVVRIVENDLAETASIERE